MQSEKVIDDIYGEQHISSPVLLELMASGPMQRLKHINQFGIPDEFYHIPGFDRFVHSLGVMVVLARLDATEEEQVAGLLHDVSHTAFSHVIDWVMHNSTAEDYQDKQHLKIVNSPEIRTILLKYGYSPERIADYGRFSLLEQDMPHLCADRFDYALREFPLPKAKRLSVKVRSYDGRMIFADKTSAKEFGELYLDRQMTHWGGYEAVVRYAIFAEILRKALDLHVISFDDFMKDDAFMMTKLKKTKDGRIKRLLELLRMRSLKALPKADHIQQKKLRYVDPEYLDGGRLVSVGATDITFKLKLEMAKRTNDDGIRMPIF